MFCPDCGKANSPEQKFCRSCGLSLEKVAESVAEQRPATELNKHLKDRQRQIERLLSIILGSMFTVFVGAILWAVIYKTFSSKAMSWKEYFSWRCLSQRSPLCYW